MTRIGDSGGPEHQGAQMLGPRARELVMAKVMFARFYAVVIQDRALFESTLKEVLATPANVFPQQRLANEIARRRAARYLAHVEDYF